MLRVIVVVQTVPWRESGYVRMMDALDEQTLTPDLVVSIFDGKPSNQALRIEPGIWKTERIALINEEPQGPGTRWRWLAEEMETHQEFAQIHHLENQETVALVIDDDFIVPPTYVEHSVGALLAARAGAVSWNGTDIKGNFIRWTEEPVRTLDLSILGAGTCVLWPKFLVGISEHEAASDYFCVGGDDEAFVSWWLWNQGCVLARPAGGCGIVSDDRLQFDPRSQWCSMGRRHGPLRERLRRDYGWTTYTDPPLVPLALVGTGRDRPWARPKRR